MKTTPTIIASGNTLLAAAFLLIPSTHAAPEADKVEPEFHIPKISPKPDDLAKVAEAKQPAVFSFGLVTPGGGSLMNKGFFLNRDGNALCPLMYLCRDALPRFDASDGTILDRPKVLATFPDHDLALLKFNYQPKAWLEIAAKRPDVGQWVAHVSTLRDPPSPVGPVLSYRAGFEWNRYPAVSTNMGYAAGRNPSLQRIFASGAPLINSEGKAVAVHIASIPLPLQTLYTAMPLDDLGARIEATLKNPGDLALPIDAKHHLFDAAVLSPEWGLIAQAGGAGKVSAALERTRKLLERYPDCRALKAREWEFMRMQGAGAITAEEFLAATQRSAPPENAGEPEKAYYQFRLGTALHEIPGREEGAKTAYRKAFALAPELVCVAGANLADLLMLQGHTKEGEALLRKVATLTPERIDYIELLRGAVEDRGDWKVSEELGRWIYQLEECYRSR